MIRSLVAVSFAAFLPALANAQQPDIVEVTGQVIDAVTTAPVANALVEIPEADIEVLANRLGRFRVSLPAGTYNWRISRLGYVDLIQESTVVGEENLRIGLMPEAIEIDAVVVDAPTIERLFDRRRVSAGVSVQMLESEEVRGAGAPTVEAYLRRKLGFVMCPETGVGPNPSAGSYSSTLWQSLIGFPGCILYRGRTIPVAVYVDEEFRLGGVTSLFSYNPEEIYAIEVWRYGAEVRVFTNRYIERVSNGRAALTSLPAPPPGGF